MIVAENDAKRFLAPYGLRVPRGRAAHSVEEAIEIAEGLGYSCVVKALIPTGGRGKAGGVKACAMPEQVREAAEMLLGHEMLGHRVQAVLVEEKVSISREIYAGVVANTASDMIDLVVSFEGGVEVESLAQRDRSAILQMSIEPGDILPIHRVRRWLQQSAPQSLNVGMLAEVLVQLYRAAADLDAILLEVNPLAVTSEGMLSLVDCKLEVDDNAIPRQPQLAELYRASLSERELRARELGVSYVPLDGDIGVITSGAGLGMATLDLLKRSGLSPANFLDTGGGISEAMVKGALELIMEPPQVKGAIVNLYGGINRMVEAAKGILAALENIPGNRPIVVKIIGNQQEEAWQMLRHQPDIHIIQVVQTEAAVAKLAELVGER
jgi:succinyl-CoA synthetase beta subunit